ncbi:MAG: hypothetical protein ACXADH_15670 [Candidatus Kariarchaeaceae archaeon]|jgi:hypothetical protein
MSSFGNLQISEQVQVQSDIYAKRINSCTPTIVNIPTATDSQTVVAETDTVIVNFASGTATAQEVIINYYNADYPDNIPYIMMDHYDYESVVGEIEYKVSQRLITVAPGTDRSLYVVSRHMVAGSGNLPSGTAVIRLYGIHNYHVN